MARKRKCLERSLNGSCLRYAKTRYKVFKATNLPSGAYNKAYVYDYEIGGVARKPDGVLAYFKTQAQAKRWAQAANRKGGR